MTPILPAESFERLVHAHHAEVYRCARRIVGNDADALDVTQQVFLRALAGRSAHENADERGRGLRWLAARTALAHLRQSRTRQEKEEQHAVERAVEQPDDEVSRAEARRELRRELDQLPQELRAALVLRFHEGWTFAQIAGEQACSEPSAHDRVQRGLERLRARLSRLGFAGFAAALPRELALEAPESASAVPEGLERQLIGLRPAAAASGSAKVAAGFLALASIVAVGAISAAWPRADSGGEERALVEAPVLTPEQSPALPEGPAGGRTVAAQDRPREPAASAGTARGAGDEHRFGTMTGRCVDEFRAPIAAVSVFAVSLQHDGKFSRFSASAATGSDGRFELRVPVSLATGESYDLATRHPDFVAHAHKGATALADKPVELGDFELLRSSHDAPGASTLEVRVTDPAGAPVRHAQVDVFRTVKGADGAPTEEREAGATTDAGGRVALALARLGAKRLHVLPPPGELGGASIALGIDAPGRFEREVHLERGLTITGTLFGFGAPLVHGRGGFLAAHTGGYAAWIQAEIDDATGAFALRGLEDRTYTLVHDGDAWSRVELRDVRAGTSGLAIQLKLESDTRDIGDHQAELHGEVRDEDGRVVPIAAFAIDVELIEDPAASWERDVLPGLVFQRPRQTAMFGEYVPPPAFHVDGLRAGRYALIARFDGYAPAFAGPFELREGELATGIVVALERPAVVSGTLTDPDGRPLADGFVRVTGFGEASLRRDGECDAELRATRGRGAIGVWDDVRTDAQGRFTFRSLPASIALRLALHHPDFEMAHGEPLALKSGERTELGRVATGAKLPK